MRDPTKLATIECSACSAWIDVFLQYEPEIGLIWAARDGDPHTCQQPPSTTCVHARAEVLRRYPDGGDHG